MGRRLKNKPIVCLVCGKDESETEFNKYNKATCKKCIAEKRKIRYDKIKVEFNRAKREQRAKLKQGRRKRWLRKNVEVSVTDWIDKIPLIDENNLKVIEVYCTEFGCGKKLTRTEKLAGNKCLKHQVYIRNIF